VKDPEPIKLSGEELERVKKEISESNLSESTKLLLDGLIQFCLWLQIKLKKSLISIHKLKKLFFIKSEKRGRKKGDDDSKDDPTTTPDNDDTNAQDTGIPSVQKPNENITENNLESPPKKRIGHGRLGADDYPNAEVITILHPDYKASDPCPSACGGKLYDPEEPGLFIHIQGNDLFKATRYETQALRCALCGERFKASKPEHVTEKYDTKAKAVICAQKYEMGMPLYRMAQWQEQVKSPMPDTTQWKRVKEVDECIIIIFDLLMTLAAQSYLFYQDDTVVRILSVMAANKKNQDEKARTGMFTTGIVAYYDEYPIYLFLSGTQHAGENLGEVLSHRDPSLPAPIKMSDALSRNNSSIPIETIICYCLIHGRRQFINIEGLYPKDCEFVLDCIAEIYKYEAHCKTHHYSAEQRLKYHQEMSGPIMDKLKAFMIERMKSSSVEPNSPLGAAFKYMLKYWKELTLFLRVAGAPLDSNIVERALKLAIRVRKASLFFKTTRGAEVGNHMMSVIHTALQSGVDPVAYLTALQDYKDLVAKAPMQWLPWSYEATIAQLHQEQAA
jgi:hypothetical protein